MHAEAHAGELRNQLDDARSRLHAAAEAARRRRDEATEALGGAQRALDARQTDGRARAAEQAARAEAERRAAAAAEGDARRSAEREARARAGKACEAKLALRRWRRSMRAPSSAATRSSSVMAARRRLTSVRGCCAR